MLEPRDLEQIETVVDRVVERRLGDVLEIVNEGFSEMQKHFDALNVRVDKLYSLVDGFISLHQKVDQELTMLRAKVDRQEEEIQKIKAKLAIA